MEKMVLAFFSRNSILAEQGSYPRRTRQETREMPRGVYPRKAKETGSTPAKSPAKQKTAAQAAPKAKGPAKVVRPVMPGVARQQKRSSGVEEKFSILRANIETLSRFYTNSDNIAQDAARELREELNLLINLRKETFGPFESKKNGKSIAEVPAAIPAPQPPVTVAAPAPQPPTS